jgi:hypothetical protein
MFNKEDSPSRRVIVVEREIEREREERDEMIAQN